MALTFGCSQPELQWCQACRRVSTCERHYLSGNRSSQQPRLFPRPPASHSHAEEAEAGIQPLPQVVPIHAGISSGRFDNKKAANRNDRSETL